MSKMSELKERTVHFLNNESGAEIAEVGIWLALIVAISIVTIALLGQQIQATFLNITAAVAAAL